LVASGTSVASIAKAANMLHGIPGLLIDTVGLAGQVFLGPAGSTVIAVVRAGGSLASNSFIAGETLAGTNLAVTETSVGALSPRMNVVGIDNSTDPGKVLGASSQRAIRASPLRLSIEAGEAQTVVVHLAGAVIGAVVLAKTTHAVPLLVPADLAPTLLVEGRHGCWERCWRRVLCFDSLKEGNNCQ